MPNKIRLFIWRLAHNSHPVRASIARKGIKLDTLCPMCGRLDEDSSHLFLKCKYVKQVWRRLNLEEVRVSLASQRSAQDVMESIFALNDKNMLKVVVLLWCWWSARNKANQGERRASTEEIYCSVTYHLNEMQKLKPPAKYMTIVRKRNGSPTRGSL
jgi:hypothetical protein